ncbi:PREDICTED: LOW QUALITY PROTEIN: glycine N-acyltransferase-like protein 3 [Corvus brachyrhynchos]|uniref:LOW QUALITY PROTEIN: glycine N-acyltransferase-like protein 3 n=1 Tax=Corvus brachyrhynchos TaxID=85066 RepID=UPI00081640FB|nr:PREDICTED: LOW QUALITY PROTEIN: glycine N-acyltransferase-like protein 3 [Corvus brachyrhynchos]
MQILTHPAQLQRLEGILRKELLLTPPLPQVFGAVLNINRGNPGQFEVLVDKWPEFGAVLARPSGEVPVNDGYWNTQAAFYRDLGAYRALLETPGCLRWDVAFTLIGLQDGVTTVSQDLAGRKGVELDIVEYYSYWHPDPSTMPEPRVALTVAAQRAQARGFPTFGHTALGNRPMQQLQELLGHQRLPGVCRYILHNPSLDRDGP